MNHKDSANVQHRGLYQELPERPSWSIECLIEFSAGLNDHSDTSTVQEAACSIHKGWTIGLIEAERVLKGTANRMMVLDIP